jgi:acyl carrier protein
MTQQEALGWIAKLFDQTPEQLSPDTAREKIKAWDSLGVLLLMGGLDSDFGIQLTDDQVQRMKTVGDILAALRAKGVLN